MLELKDPHKTFNPGTVNAKTALDGLSLTLRDGAARSGASAGASPRRSGSDTARCWAIWD